MKGDANARPYVHRDAKQAKRRAARIKAGYPTVKAAAKAAGLSTSYYRRLEREGWTAHYRAERLAQLFGCSWFIWL